jgi:two-component system phosphate regulon sensor histidine kinase PhoR
MKKRLFIYTFSIILASLLIFLAVSVYVNYTNSVSLAKETVIDITNIYAGLYNDMDAVSLAKAEGSTRVTVIAPDGTVLADSSQVDIGTLENHLERPEIQAAANGSPEAFIRHSDTLGVDLIYYALKVPSNNSYVFVRAAVPVSRIDTYLFHSLTILICLLLVVGLLCFLLIRNIVKRIITPFGSVEQKLQSLADGHYKQEPIAGSYEEIKNIARNIDEVALVLQKSMDGLRVEKNKMDYILSNIGDGLFVVDENQNISLVNSAALDIFNATSEIYGKNLSYLSYDELLTGAVTDCVNLAKSALFEFAHEGKIYLASVKRLPGTVLTMVVMSDVTENRENQKHREEFFSNASHELKTPLTAIKGFNELTSLNNKDESLRKYIDGITRETDRMLSLIGDMLKLSELENAGTLDPVPVSLAKIVDEARESLSVTIAQKSITFKIDGDGTVEAEPGHVYDLVKNLIENAVRYNNQGGSVSVKIESSENEVRLIVSDNGIGISPEEQSRIFERFYRVEKSRSQQNGGTGLGLSIVKHICALYNWKLSLKSKFGVGTDIEVVFKGHNFGLSVGV